MDTSCEASRELYIAGTALKAQNVKLQRVWHATGDAYWDIMDTSCEAS